MAPSSKPQTRRVEIEEKYQSPTGFCLDITHVKEICGKSEKQRLNILSRDTILQIFCKQWKNCAFFSQYVRLCYLVLHWFFNFFFLLNQISYFLVACSGQGSQCSRGHIIDNPSSRRGGSLMVATRLCYEFLSGRDSGAQGVLGNLQGVTGVWKWLTPYQVKSPQG